MAQKLSVQYTCLNYIHLRERAIHVTTAYTVRNTSLHKDKLLLNTFHQIASIVSKLQIQVKITPEISFSVNLHC